MSRTRLEHRTPSTRGPKPKYTKEVLDKMGKEMYDTIISDESILFVRRFFSSIDIHMSVVYSLLGVSKYFKERFFICQQICADRVHDGALKNKINQNHAAKFMHFFDPEVDKNARDLKKADLKDTIETTKKVTEGKTDFVVTLQVDKI